MIQFRIKQWYKSYNGESNSGIVESQTVVQWRVKLWYNGESNCGTMESNSGTMKGQTVVKWRVKQ